MGPRLTRSVYGRSRESHATRLRGSAAALAIVAAGFGPSAAMASSLLATWNGGAGDWTESSWTFSAPPAGPAFPNNNALDQFNVRIDGGNAAASSVRLETNVAIDSLRVDAKDSLAVDNTALVIVQDPGRPDSGRLENAGSIGINSIAAGTASLAVNGSAIFTGGGVLNLTGPATQSVFPGGDRVDSKRAATLLGGVGTLTNQDHTIAGTGFLGGTTLEIRNLAGGVVDANAAESALVVLGKDAAGIAGAGVTNLGTLQASDGGTLRLFFGTYRQDDGSGPTGTIQARAGSTVQVEASQVAVEGGKLRSEVGGTLLMRQSLVTLDNAAVENAGNFEIGVGQNFSSLVTVNGGSISNSGTIGIGNSALTLDNVTVANNGTIGLNSSGSGAAQLIVSGSTKFEGGGVLNLTGPADTIVLPGFDLVDTKRAATMVSGTGTLTNEDHTIAGTGLLGSATMGLRNLDGGVIDADAPGAVLAVVGKDPAGIDQHGVLNLGTMQASGGGTLRLFSGTYRQEDASGSTGTIQALAGSTVQLEATDVEVDGGRLRTDAGGSLAMRQAVVTLNGTKVENVGNFEIGVGKDFPAAVTLNGGSIVNTGAIAVENSPLALNNVAAVENGGTIGIKSTGTSAAVLTVNGSTIFQGGGVLNLSGPATTAVFGGDLVETKRAATTLSGNGTLTNQDHTIAGTGFLGSTSLGIRNLAGGVIDANAAGSTLVVLGKDPAGVGGAGVTNLGKMQASDGGTLRLFFGTYRQDVGSGPTGTIQALAGSTVQVESSQVTIDGGAVRSDTGGTILVRQSLAAFNDTAVENAGKFEIGVGRDFGSFATINGGSLANSGTIVVDNSALLLNNLASVENSGAIGINSGGSGIAGLTVNGSTTFTGGGVLNLTGPATEVVFPGGDLVDSKRAATTLAGSGTLTNQDHTIAGTGFLGSTTLGIRNLAGGVIDANAAGSALVVLGKDAAGIGGSGVTNLGKMQASDGGTLRLFSGTYRQDDGTGPTGTIQALAGSTVQVEGSQVTVQGGTVRSEAGGTLLARGSLVRLDHTAVENAGTLEIGPGKDFGSFVSLNGSTLSNAGAVRVSGSVLDVADSQIKNGATIEAKSGATIDLASSTVVGGTFKVGADSILRTSGASTVDGVTVAGSLGNIGALSIASGGLSVSDTYAQQGGATRLAGGALKAGLVDIQSGMLSGNGTVIGPASINGAVSAGNSAGILNFVGDASFGGALEVEIGGLLLDSALPLIDRVNVGTDPLTTQFDQYNVFAAATLLDGLIVDVDLLGGFVPTIGSFFDVFTADDLIADLNLLDFVFPTLGNGTRFAASIAGFDGREALRFTVVAAPEPSTLSLAGLGLLGLLYAARRQRRA